VTVEKKKKKKKKTEITEKKMATPRFTKTASRFSYTWKMLDS
jgi:hypothetical protein